MGLRKKHPILGAYDKFRGLFEGRFTKYKPVGTLSLWPSGGGIAWNKPITIVEEPMNVMRCQVCGRPGSTVCPYCTVNTFPPCTVCGYKFKPGDTGHSCVPPLPKPRPKEAAMLAWHEMWCETCQKEKAMGDTTRPQQDPSEGKTSVTDLVLADIKERREQGIAKYGTELKTQNGRKALVDLYQELLDAVMYVRQAIEERKERNEEIVSAQMKDATLEQMELFPKQPGTLDVEGLYSRPGRFIPVTGNPSTSKLDCIDIKIDPIYHTTPTESVAQEAHRLVLGDRGASYGHPIFDMTRSADMLTALLRDKLKPGARLEAEDIGQTMICVKQSRHRNAAKRDNLTDTAGYALTLQMIKEWRDAHPGEDPRNHF